MVQLTFKVYMTDFFFIYLIKSPQSTDKYSKKFFRQRLFFRSRQLREKQIFPTFSYFLINNALLYHFLATWLAHNKKMTEKSVFRQAWSPEMTSQSFPVSCFWSRGFVPHRKWNIWRYTGKENRYRNFFLDIHISTLRRFNQANKKICHIYFKNVLKTRSKTESKLRMSLSFSFCHFFKWAVSILGFHQSCDQNKNRNH